MATIPVTVHNREYQLACEDGQEELLVALAQEVDDRVKQLTRSLPNAGESMLLLLTALTLADELSDERRAHREARQQQAPSEEPRLREMETAMAATLQDVATRIERIARELENR